MRWRNCTEMDPSRLERMLYLWLDLLESESKWLLPPALEPLYIIKLSLMLSLHCDMTVTSGLEVHSYCIDLQLYSERT